MSQKIDIVRGEVVKIKINNRHRMTTNEIHIKENTGNYY